MVDWLLSKPTDDSVEIAVGFMREVGAFLLENTPRANDDILSSFRKILHLEDGVSARVQYMIEVLFQVVREKYKDNPILPEGLDLVQEENQITHKLSFDDPLHVQESLSMSNSLLSLIFVCHLTSALDLFKFDPNFLENEERYSSIKNEIFGSDDEGEESGTISDDEDDSDEEGRYPCYLYDPSCT